MLGGGFPPPPQLQELGKNIPIFFANQKYGQRFALLYAVTISAWTNQGSVMCLLSILNQKK